MARLEDLTRGAQLKGIRADGPVEVIDVKWHGTSAAELTYKGLWLWFDRLKGLGDHA